MKHFLICFTVCALAFCLAGCGNSTFETTTASPASEAVSASETASESAPEPSSSKALSESETSELVQSASAVSAVQETKKNAPSAWWEEPFLLSAADGRETVSQRVYRYSDQVSAVVLNAVELLDGMNPVQSGEIGAPLADLDALMLTTADDKRYTLTLYEKGVAVSKSEAGGDANAPEKLLLDETRYAALLENLREDMAEGPWASSWLSVMRESKADWVRITNTEGGRSDKFQKGDVNFETAFCALNSFLVEPGSVKKCGAQEGLGDAVHIPIAFINGIEYEVWMDGTDLLVTSTDMDYGLRYKAVSSPELFEMMTEGKTAPLTGKPVIYLYPEHPMDVSVKVHFQGRLLNTIPAYNGGWHVTAYPGSRLVNKADGKSYDSLFWDGNARINWDFSEGFSVRGADTERFLREKLTFLGLNEQETKDFLEFWLPELQQNRYNLITFSTEQYEAAAPLEISPKPDRMLRVHMVFRPLSKPVEIPAQTLRPFERGGFTVVEWGGSRA